MNIPLVYFPTTINIIDDDKNFLKMLSMLLVKEGYNVNIFTDNEKFLTATNHSILLNWLYQNIFFDEEESFEEHLVSIKISKIVELMNFVEKTQQVSVIIADYDMPYRNGLDVCNDIQNSEVQKILLTGVVDENVAVQAFNAGFINTYLKKHSPQLMNDIINAIRNCQKNYFYKLFEKTRVINPSHSLKILSNKQFNDIFNRILREKNIKEYYIKSLNGSYLLKDNLNKLIHLYTMVIVPPSTFLTSGVIYG